MIEETLAEEPSDPSAPSGLSDVTAHLQGCSRILVLSGPSRRYVDRLLAQLSAQLPEASVRVFDGARRHVPAAVLTEALASFDDFKPDAVIALGGGASIGLGKALRLERSGFRFVAIPTTYAGSEYTSIYGITDGQQKRTGRDPRVVPDAVLPDVELTLEMPAQLTATSLLNALSHPISSLSADSQRDVKIETQALEAARQVFQALELLTRLPTSPRARTKALSAVKLAAGVLERGQLGAHHQLAHALGGRFDLPHAELHSVLLPQSVGELTSSQPQLVDRLQQAVGVDDLPAALFDLLRRAGAATSLRALGVEHSSLIQWLEQNPQPNQDLIMNTFHGRRPSAETRQEDWGLREKVALRGPQLTDARLIVLAIHGRGSSAEEILQRANELVGDQPDVTLVAPQAPNNSWYSGRYSDPKETLGGELTAALQDLEQALARLGDKTPVAVFGFSQGGCLALELMAAHAGRFQAVIAPSGARIGSPETLPAISADLNGVPLLLGISAQDSWVDPKHVEAAAQAFSAAGAKVELINSLGDAHRFTQLQKIHGRELLFGAQHEPHLLAGYGNVHQAEALPGALPKDQNAPRQAPYGLYPEQINAVGFTAPRHQNLHSWLYRIRPSAQQRPFSALEHPTCSNDFGHCAPEPNLVGFRPLPLPADDTALDFVDGLYTVGGAGSPRLRRGFALHVYTANRSMDDRAFCSTDGHLLILPQLGTLTLLTELGTLSVSPGQLAVIPKGIRFSVLLDASARGYVAEVFGRAFELPERGPIGANGLADARHFVAPSVWHEDRVCPGFRITNKFGGKFYEATQDYSPFDVVAWHGSCVPYVYDTANFSPVSSVRIDHADPSIYTVLSAPLDETGANNLDLVIFPPRWDATQHTFRPPFFHRNATTEFNGVIRGKSGFPFEPGCYFMTPSMTPHGSVAATVEASLAASDEQADKPEQVAKHSLWFQFETTLPVSLSKHAQKADNRVADWHEVWGSYRTHFRPTK